MKRRDFLQSTLLASAGLIGANAEAAPANPMDTATPARELYELRVYHLRRGPMPARWDNYCREAFIPALNRAGCEPVGVFTVMTGPDIPSVYVLIPYKSLEAFQSLPGRLNDDAQYQKAGADFLNTVATDPAYIRVESSLLRAFESVPALVLPELKKTDKARMFELRTYESHSQKASQTKISMFNRGEIAIFKKTGVTPVFFGETLIGGNLSSLVYMVVFADMPEHDKAWSTFSADPEWQKLRSQPGLGDADIVSNISNVFLRPAPYSQI